MAITHVFAGVATTDYDSALAWYVRLLGRPPDRFPREQEAVWQLTETSLIYLVDDTDRAGGALLTIAVDDLDGHLADLAGRGLSSGAIDASPGAVRRAMITDPAGNRLTFFEGPGTQDPQ